MTSAAGMTKVAAMASQLSFVFSLSIFNGDAVFVETIFFTITSSLSSIRYEIKPEAQPRLGSLKGPAETRLQPVSYELSEASSNASMCPFNCSPVKNPFHCWNISPLGLRKYVAGVPSTL